MINSMMPFGIGDFFRLTVLNHPSTEKGTEKGTEKVNDNMSTKSIKVSAEQTLPTEDLSPRDRIDISHAWQDVARDINVRDASPREIITLSGVLYEAGAISYDDHLNLSFQPEINLDVPTETKPFSHDRKDYLALWQAKQDNVLLIGGDRHQIEDTHRIHGILSYVDSLK